MCNKCLNTTAELLATMLRAHVVVAGHEDDNEGKRDVEDDLAMLLGLARAKQSDEQEKINADQMAEAVQDMGAARMAKVIHLCGYFEQALRIVNVYGMTAMLAFAEYGDVRAAMWLARQASSGNMVTEDGSQITVKIVEHDIHDIEPPDLRGVMNLN